MLGGALGSRMGRGKERRMVHKRVMVKGDGLVSLKALRKESMLERMSGRELELKKAQWKETGRELLSGQETGRQRG
jgi:hypothetical protein